MCDDRGKGLVRCTVDVTMLFKYLVRLHIVVAERLAWHSSKLSRTSNVSSVSLSPLREGRDRPYVKSLETASMKLGADMRMVKVQMMEKSEKATRHNRSTTAAANFHSLQIASPSSWSRKRLAMYCTSSRIREISGTCSSSRVRVCSERISCWDEPLGWPPPPPPPHTTTPESVLGGKAGLSVPIEW